MNPLSRTTTELSELFHYYYDEDVIKVIRSTEAFANEVYDITDNKGQGYFLKILKNQSPELIAQEVSLQQKIMDAGLSAPLYLKTKDGSYVGTHDGVNFVLSQRLPGESPRRITSELIESFGATLAKIHHAFNGVHIKDNDMQWLDRTRVLNDVKNYHGEVEQDLSILLEKGGVIFDKHLPVAVIHGDLWTSNVFADNNTITTVFDFETAERTIRLIDLARTYTSMRSNSEYSHDAIVEHLIEGYNSVAIQPLTQDEIESFNLAIAYVSGVCATWHAVHGTRYRDPYIKYGKEALANNEGNN